MSKNLSMIEINEYELDQLHSDLDKAGNDLFLQEGKIKELEEKLQLAEDEAEKRGEHCNLLMEKLKVAEALMYKLYNALNCAHGYIDPNENKRTDKLCMEALCEYEKIKGEK